MLGARGNRIMDILIGIVIGALSIGLGLFIWRRFTRWIDARIAAQIAPFFTPSKTDKPDIKENTLAKEIEIKDNPLVTQSGRDTDDPKPFWNDREQIKAAMDRITGSVYDPESEPELAGLTEHEAWQKLDTRYLDLENIDADAINA